MTGVGITGNKLSGVVDILVRDISGDASLVGEILHPFLFVYTIKILPYVALALRISLGTMENIYMWRMRQPKDTTEWQPARPPPHPVMRDKSNVKKSRGQKSTRRGDVGGREREM